MSEWKPGALKRLPYVPGPDILKVVAKTDEMDVVLLWAMKYSVEIKIPRYRRILERPLTYFHVTQGVYNLAKIAADNFKIQEGNVFPPKLELDDDEKIAIKRWAKENGLENTAKYLTFF